MLHEAEPASVVVPETQSPATPVRIENSALPVFVIISALVLC